ncbi:MAG: MBL fold metallo-hydrolase [Ferruginibacter sp.]
MLVQQIVHPAFTSNTYIISNKVDDDVWLVDIGNYEGAMELIPDTKTVKGVFITHYHYDHIYGINDLIDKFPNCEIYASSHTIEGLYSDKMNLSFYHENPIVFKGRKTVTIKENDKINLFEGDDLEVIETPGHNIGCLTFKVHNYLFTGDSYIPSIEVITKLKGGDKVANKLSLQKIKNKIVSGTCVCPGHGNIVRSN